VTVEHITPLPSSHTILLQKTLEDMKEADDIYAGRSVLMQVLENAYRFALGAVAGGTLSKT